jgi:hypothetical protein
MSKQKTEEVAGRILVARRYNNGSDSQEETTLPIMTFETTPAQVTARFGLTLNLGNYESARCDCYVTLPCYLEEIDSALKSSWDIAEKEVQKQVESIRATPKATRTPGK